MFKMNLFYIGLNFYFDGWLFESCHTVKQIFILDMIPEFAPLGGSKIVAYLQRWEEVLVYNFSEYLLRKNRCESIAQKQEFR